jgi:hypothetical protein
MLLLCFLVTVHSHEWIRFEVILPMSQLRYRFLIISSKVFPKAPSFHCLSLLSCCGLAQKILDHNELLTLWEQTEEKGKKGESFITVAFLLLNNCN